MKSSAYAELFILSPRRRGSMLRGGRREFFHSAEGSFLFLENLKAWILHFSPTLDPPQSSER